MTDWIIPQVNYASKKWLTILFIKEKSGGGKETTLLLIKLLSFDFCLGSEDESPVENLGQVLFGERIRPSPYKVSKLSFFIFFIY